MGGGYLLNPNWRTALSVVNGALGVGAATLLVGSELRLALSGCTLEVQGLFANDHHNATVLC